MFLKATPYFLDDTPWDDLCEGTLFEHLVMELSKLNPLNFIGKRSRGLKSELKAFGDSGPKSSHRFRWTSDILITDATGMDKDANFTATGLMACQDCDTPRKVYVHLAVNNREAIGTNLLRANLAAESSTAPGALVLITLGRELLDLGGWDRSYGDTKEFIIQYKLGYGSALKRAPAIVELNSPL
jgi:hypothetical protein